MAHWSRCLSVGTGSTVDVDLVSLSIVASIGIKAEQHMEWQGELKWLVGL
jgi:hypothetical protein